MSRLILAYDLGTGGNKAFLFDEIGNCDASTFVPFETSYPEPGWYEQRPMDWWDAVVQSTNALLSAVHIDRDRIVSIALSVQSLGVVPLDRNGGLFREFMPIWSDTRAREQVKRFFEGFDEGKWYRMTGNGFSRECYPSFKIMWYRDNEPALYGRCSKILGSKDFINFKLTGQMLTDYSYASGSGVYELTRWNYSSALIQASDLDPGLFPDIVPSTHVLGKLSREASDTLNIPSNVFVVCGGVDNSCMALGAGDIAEGGCISHLAHRHGLPYPPKNQSSIQR
jgi:xylulokinase